MSAKMDCAAPKSRRRGPTPPTPCRGGRPRRPPAFQERLRTTSVRRLDPKSDLRDHRPLRQPVKRPMSHQAAPLHPPPPSFVVVPRARQQTAALAPPRRCLLGPVPVGQDLHGILPWLTSRAARACEPKVLAPARVEKRWLHSSLVKGFRRLLESASGVRETSSSREMGCTFFQLFGTCSSG